MTSNDPNNPNTGTGAILRALGGLMAALGGDNRGVDDGAQPTTPPVYESQRDGSRGTGTPPRPQPQRFEAARPAPAPGAFVPSPATSTEVEMLLSDARRRAESILQESMERANDLLARDRQNANMATRTEVDSLRRSMDELLQGLRDVQSRVGRIESILGNGRAPIAPPAAATPIAPPPTAATPIAPPAPVAPPASVAPPPAPPRPAFAPPPPPEEERRPGGLSVVAPQPSRPAAPPPPPPAAIPPSAVPPMRGSGQSAAAHAPQRQPEPEPEVEEAPAAWQRDDGEAVGTLATFTPADGAVQLRAAPVSGFQGLMRLQDALQRIAAVRQATVEAYSQGEARLRLELSADVDSDEIAEGLSAGLGQSAVVQEASEGERSITIAFG